MQVRSDPVDEGAAVKDISAKGIIVGGVVDIIASNLLMLPVIIHIVRGTNLSDVAPADRTQALMAAIQQDPFSSASTIFLGAAASVLGGYIAARIAGRAAVLNGCLSAWLCTILGLYTTVAGSDGLPTWVHVLFLPLSPIFGALGGRLWLHRNAPASTW